MSVDRRIMNEPLSAATVLGRVLETRPDAEALVTRSGRLSYRQLEDLAARSVAALQALGVRHGDRVAVSLPNDIAIVGAFHAAMRLGAIWVGVNRALAPPEKAYILRDSEATLFLGDDEMVTQMAAHTSDLENLRVVQVSSDGSSEWESLLAGGPAESPQPPDPLDPAGIAYTSGTTGFPKGAVHSQHNLMLPGRVVVAARGYDSRLRKADCFPLTILNMHALSTLLVPQAEGTAVLMDRVDTGGLAEWLEKERPTVFNGAPAMLFGLAADDGVDPSVLDSLHEIWSGGGHTPPTTVERFRAKFKAPVITTYGLTEAPSLVTILPVGDDAHHHTSGQPLPHLAIEILDDDGRPAPPGMVGEVTIRATSSGPWAGAYRPMLGYWHRPEATETALAGGALHTGDLGSLDEDGYLIVADRQSSLILRGGSNVYPAEVERVLDAHWAVADSCVVGVPDPRLGERVAAMVEPVAGATIDEAELRRHCEANLARYKVPERIVIGELPRNSMGKVRRVDVGRSMAPESSD